MPKRARELTAIEVKNLKAGTWAVGQVQGLYIRKSDTNSFFFCATAIHPEKDGTILSAIIRKFR